jgi:SAM-dependent methyltransferase
MFWNVAREMHFGSRECFEYLACSDCGCVQIAEIPADLDRFYPDRYYARAEIVSRQEALRPASRVRAAWTDLRLSAGSAARAIAGRRYARFRWFTRTGIDRHNAILDVGCGSGRLLRNLHRDGFLDLTGIDPHFAGRVSTALDWEAESPRFMRLTPDAYARDANARTFSLVMAHHSFEHVENPRVVFEAFARLVVPGGWLLLRVPLADSWACETYGSDWIQLDPPRHLHLHTRRSVGRLAADFGFRVAEVADDSGPFQIWGSESIRRDIPLVAARHDRRGTIARGMRRVFSRLRARDLRSRHLGDQACFYLQRDRTSPHCGDSAH